MFDRVIVVVASRWFRLVLVSLLVLSLQTTLFSEVRPFGYAIQILAIFVASAGAAHGVYTGAIAGLVSGFMYDAILATPLRWLMRAWSMSCRSVPPKPQPKTEVKFSRGSC